MKGNMSTQLSTRSRDEAPSERDGPALPVGGPTLASTWLGASGTPIGDELLEWPPDVFALTDVLLERAEAFRFVLSPPPGSGWPPERFTDWGETVRDAAQRW